MRIRVERVLVVFIMHYYHFKDEMKCLSLRSISYSVVNTPRFFFLQRQYFNVVLVKSRF